MTKIFDSPDWFYVVREFDTVYRNGSAGGSKTIRSHMTEVRRGVARVLAGDPDVRPLDPQRLPVCDHLKRALDNGRNGAMRSMVQALESIADGLRWEYGYERLPRHLERRYAYAELLGPRGPINWPDLILGLVLFAPRTTYPAHSHDGITESYVSLSGYWSENDAGVYAPGSLVLNQAGHTHTITTADREPALLAYAWTGAAEKLAGSIMQFERRRKNGSLR